MQQLSRKVPASIELQVKALREALERASRAAADSESVVIQIRNDLKAERQRMAHAHAELARLSGDLKQALADNRRLRRSIGDFHRERLTLAERIRELAGYRSDALPETANFRVVQTDDFPDPLAASAFSPPPPVSDSAEPGSLRIVSEEPS